MDLNNVIKIKDIENITYSFNADDISLVIERPEPFMPSYLQTRLNQASTPEERATIDVSAYDPKRPQCVVHLEKHSFATYGSLDEVLKEIESQHTKNKQAIAHRQQLAAQQIAAQQLAAQQASLL